MSVSGELTVSVEGRFFATKITDLTKIHAVFNFEDVLTSDKEIKK